jgi:hypothetical protein
VQGLIGRCLLFAVLTTLGAAPIAGATDTFPGTNPLVVLPPPAQGHPYRHGVVPQRGQLFSGARSTAGTALAANSTLLTYGGGVSGVGVTTGAPKVYLVFWGSQWGTQGTNSKGDVTLSGDPSGMAPYLQEFLKGIGTGGETWSGVMTQYCQGISPGSKTCPAGNAQHVGYPTGGALAGVWVDGSSAEPAAATANQLAAESVNAAGHFGNTTSTSNRNTQYVIVSPTGADPDNWTTGGFCAWHDSTNDGYSVSAAHGALAFTNLPYITDAGSSCGEDFVNRSTGTLDGVSIVEGHEYAETITDQYPVGGWTDGSPKYDENGDLCAWISSGQGASQNITLTTGTFAVQSTWANDFNNGAGGCEVSHAIVTDGNTVTVTNPGSQTSTYAAAITPLQMTATDSASGQTFTWSAMGLPSGVTINSSTGAISGTPTAVGSPSVTVTATDSTSASGSTTFTWTVGKRSTSTAVACSPTSVSIGVQTTCTATVTDTAAGTANTPTGSVNFTPTANCTLAAGATTGTASCQASLTPAAAGTFNVSAAYQGDSTHTASNGGSQVAATLRSTTTGLTCDTNTLNAGSSTTCTATVSDTDAGNTTTPTGSVDFSAVPADGGFASGGACQLSESTPGVATCGLTYTPTSPGSPAVSAAYQGDGTHATSTSNGFGLTVGGDLVSVTNPGDQSSTYAAAITPLQMTAGDSASGQTFTWSATGLPTGLSIDTRTGAISGAPTAAGSTSVTITATDSTGASDSATFMWKVGARSTSASLSCAPGTVTAGTASTCTAAVTDTDAGTVGTPTGTVTVPGTSGCTLAPTSTPGLAECQATYTPLAAGAPSLTATYAGDTTHTGSVSSPYTLTVLPSPETTVTAPATGSSSSGSGGGQTSGSGQSQTPAGQISPAPRTTSTPSPPKSGFACPPATGRPGGSVLGLARIGMTRKQVRAAYVASSLKSGLNQDVFCLAGGNLRVGYPTARLLRLLTAADRQRLAGHAVWVTTVNPRYRVGGSVAGASVATAARFISHAREMTVGVNTWYVVVSGKTATLVEVRGGHVREVGIASRTLTRDARVLAALVASLA